MWISKIIYKSSVLLMLGWMPVITTGAETQEIIDERKSSISQDVLTLEMAVSAALEKDPWLVGNQHIQDSIEAMSVSAGTLPDPKVSISTLNLPVDTFDIGQENMTNFLKVGVSQMFPRGDSLVIRKKQLELEADQYPYQRQDRKARLAVKISQLWLDAYKAQESIALIENDRSLFEQLVDVAEIGYASAYGMTQQQDIIRAQLELTRLDDRLTKLYQQQEMFQRRLSEWLSDYFVNQYLEKTESGKSLQVSTLQLDKKLPDIKVFNSQLSDQESEINPEILYKYFSQHPSVKALDQKIESTNAGIDLAKQKYKPEWGINAGYGFRAENQFGNDRADFLSFGVTFDLPLFTANKQDKEVESAVYKAEAVKTDKWLLLRKLIASFDTAKTSLLRLNQRQELYQSQLLPQMHEQAEASLSAYTNDEGDFAEVVRARIADLNAEIDALDINVERQKSIVQLNYFFSDDANEIITENQTSGEEK